MILLHIFTQMAYIKTDHFLVGLTDLITIICILCP